MAIFEEHECIEIIEDSDYETETYDSDNDDDDSDSEEEDPTFDVIKETSPSTYSKLSLANKRKSKPLVRKQMEAGTAEDSQLTITNLPEIDKDDQKTFEVIQKLIEVGQAHKLKVDQCKSYLRKNGLRLTGNKDTLIQRIKEHLDIVNGNGEKYPASSFVLNCKGDACTGDVVMFEQNVYEMFNIASRTGNGPPCGTRVIAGRIVKESYGAAKQQHTFTIEVLWSKGEKPLPPLHPLLIKGRNLYRLKTMRQRWEDEGQRQKILFEKHNRGSAARMNREARIKEKKIRKMLRANRMSKSENEKRKQENKVQRSQALPADSEKQGTSQPHKQANIEKMHPAKILPNSSHRPETCVENTSVLPDARNGRPDLFLNARAPLPVEGFFQRPSLKSINYNPSNGPCRKHTYEDKRNFRHQNGWDIPDENNANYDGFKNPFQRHGYEESGNANLWRPPAQNHGHDSREQSLNCNHSKTAFGQQFPEPKSCNTPKGVNFKFSKSPLLRHPHAKSTKHNPRNGTFLG